MIYERPRTFPSSQEKGRSWTRKSFPRGCAYRGALERKIRAAKLLISFATAAGRRNQEVECPSVQQRQRGHQQRRRRPAMGTGKKPEEKVNCSSYNRIKLLFSIAAKCSVHKVYFFIVPEKRASANVWLAASNSLVGRGGEVIRREIQSRTHILTQEDRSTVFAIHVCSFLSTVGHVDEWRKIYPISTLCWVYIFRPVAGSLFGWRFERKMEKTNLLLYWLGRVISSISFASSRWEILLTFVMRIKDIIA